MRLNGFFVFGVLICLVAWADPVLAACQSDDECEWGETCENGVCVPCVTDCAGKDCGDDGCGGSCGSCPPGVPCVVYQCNCTPDCAGKECGFDSCGGFCGNGNAATQGCTGDEVCEYGTCGLPCLPLCDGQECGSDGCDGSCGTCPCDDCSPEEIVCSNGLCQEPLACDCACIFDCFDTCPQGDQACYQNCINSATIPGQVTYSKLMVCLDDSGYFDCPDGDDTCVEETFAVCTDEYYDCFSGDQECVEMYLCLTFCPAGAAGDACAQECFANGTKEALLTWDAFTECLDDKGYSECSDGDEACVDEAWDACEGAMMACTHGDLDCSEVLDCFDGCAPADEPCELSCRVHGTVKAQQSLNVFYDCLEAQCGEDPEAACEDAAIDGSCSPEYQACLTNTCAPQCAGRTCGNDGCGGSCGSCDPGEMCEDGQCPGPPIGGDVVGEEDATPAADISSSPDASSPNVDEKDAGEVVGHSRSGCSGTAHGTGSPTPALLILLVLMLACARCRKREEQR